MNTDYQRFIPEILQETQLYQKPSAEDLAYFEDKLPQSLLELWQEFGWGSVHDGHFWLVNPRDYEGVLELFFEHDERLAGTKHYLIGYNAFGNIVAWNDQYGVYDIETTILTFGCSDLFYPFYKNVASDEVKILSSITASSSSKPLPGDKDTYALARARLGDLDYGQIYQYTLHPAIGGGTDIDDFKIVNARAFFTFVANLGGLKDFKLPKKEILAQEKAAVEFYVRKNKLDKAAKRQEQIERIEAWYEAHPEAE